MISVIVPNHGRDITKLYESLPTYENIELVHINRGLERSAQRNMGIKEANGEFFLFLDSDQSVSPDLINECVDLMKAGYSCVYIPEMIIADGFFADIRKFEREFYTGTRVDVPRFVRRSCCPFFDLELHGPEDSDWSNRIKGERAISKNVLYHHDNIGFFEYLKKKAYYAKSMSKFKKRNPSDPVLTFKYRCWTVFTEKGKWVKLLKHPLLSLCMFFIIFLRGIIYVTRKR